MKLFLALLRVRCCEIRLHDAQEAVEALGIAQANAYRIVRESAEKLDAARDAYKKLTSQEATAS